MVENALLVACKTIEDETLAAARAAEFTGRIEWIESGLHNNPDKLRERLQQALDGAAESSVLLGFGFCGNSALGLKAREFTLVLPQVDDCITLLLGSGEKRQELAGQAGTYFLTRGWMRHENNIYGEYQHAVKKYGARRAKSLYKSILAHYSRLALVDTGVYDFEEFYEEMEPVAKLLGLERFKVKGGVSYLERLLRGDWQGGFVVAPPGHTITLGDLMPQLMK